MNRVITFLLLLSSSSLALLAESPTETERLVKEFLTRQSRFTIDTAAQLTTTEIVVIRNDARNLANSTFEHLSLIIEREGADVQLPVEYRYLVPVARYHYWLQNELVPDISTIGAFLRAFDARGQFFDAIEDYVSGIAAMNQILQQGR